MRSSTRRQALLRNILPTLLALTLASLIVPRAALAYVDPVSGSVVFQIIAAGFLGAVFTIKMWWSKAVGLVRALASRIIGR